MKKINKIPALPLIIYLSLLISCSDSKPHDLVSFITSEQGKHVRDSYGKQLGQCFTDNDYDKFISNNVTTKMTKRLRNDLDFNNVIDSIRNMDSISREILLDSAQGTYRRQWAVYGMDPDRTPEDVLLKGQTYAGYLAEKAIADSIVGLARELLSKTIR